MSTLDQRPRNLTDADVEAIVDQLRESVKREFYEDLGKGLWGFVWKCVVASMIAIAAYSGLKGVK